ncbi:NAD(P)H-binding protein [Arthrobacter sp. CDRTa11]|uniref:SDR family oxidoreductase n=1 Tax=Arthrobacter sp. CDRTa11 TaxID=2651199 RepID=UPI002265B370|nr:NAD(P)H-binding protein [Arthrobacter sp. CDRTa11]UZX02900.1 NAD(P)H-binding protein [Arthrobacter sp. CDRTa11]
MTYIVHGATGAQGSPVLAALKAHGHPAVAAVRDVSTIDGPAVAVDYSSVHSLVQAYEGAEGVFVHLPLGRPEDQTAFAETIGEAVRRARPARVVFSTSGYSVEHNNEGSDGPSTMLRELEASAVSYAVVEPRLYLENLLMPAIHEPALAEGVLRYPLREDYATSWSSHLDVADVVVHLLVNRDVTGIVSVGALPGLLGADLAAGFSKGFKKEIVFEALSPEGFGELIVPVFGEAAAVPVVESYKYRQGQTDELIPEARSAQKLLGLEPRSVELWLRDLRL